DHDPIKTSSALHAGDNGLTVLRDPRSAIVVGALLTQFTVIGLLFTTGLFVKVFEAEFGWSRTIVSTSSSLAFVMMGIYAMAAGPLNDRYGPRLMLGTTSILFGLGFVLLSLISAPWQLFAVYAIFISAGLATHDVVTLSVIARWFEKRRGQMTGVAKSGTAVGQMCMPPLMAALIVAVGWREAVVILGTAAGIILFAAAMMMKMPPKTGEQAAGAPQTGTPFAEARRDSVFWRLCAMQLLFFPTLATVPFHIVAHGMDLGLSQPAAAILLTVIGGSSILGRLNVGTFSDRIGGRRAYVLCFVPMLAALTALLLVDWSTALFGIMLIYGFAHGGLFTVVSPTIAEYFGMRAHGAIFGVVLFFGTIGGAIGPIVAGWVFDNVGSYFYAFLMLITLIAIALALALSLPSRTQTQEAT
ncbi:MAG: MFS transporter, partial [Pseudomonadota bacterium]